MNKPSEFDNQANPTAIIKDLNTIRVVLKWLPNYRKLESIDELWGAEIDDDSSKSEHVTPVVHEKAAKRGHPGSAQLSKPVSSGGECRSTMDGSNSNPKNKYFQYDTDGARRIRSVEFIFHYGPEGE